MDWLAQAEVRAGTIRALRSDNDPRESLEAQSTATASGPMVREPSRARLMHMSLNVRALHDTSATRR